MVYALTTAILSATVGAYFLWARKGTGSFGWLQWALRMLVALPLVASGLAHFARTAMFASIVPPFFPYRSQLVLLTGAMELAGALGLLVPPLTRVASACLGLLMIAIFPANVYAANQTIAGLHMPSVPVRTAMQVVYIVLLLVAGFGLPFRGKRTAGPSTSLPRHAGTGRSVRNDKS